MSALERSSTTTLIARAFVARAHGTGKRQRPKNCWKQLRATNLISCFSIPTGNHSTERSHIRAKNRYCENTILGFMRRNSLAVLKPHTTQGAWPSRRKCAPANSARANQFLPPDSQDRQQEPNRHQVTACASRNRNWVPGLSTDVPAVCLYRACCPVVSGNAGWMASVFTATLRPFTEIHVNSRLSGSDLRGLAREV